MSENNNITPYRVGIVAATATAFAIMSTPDVEAIALASMNVKPSPSITIGYSWEDTSTGTFSLSSRFGNESLEAMLENYSRQMELLSIPWLNKAIEYDRVGKCDEALDIIYDNIDEMLSKKHYKQIDKILGLMNPDEYSIDIELGLLTTTLSAKSKLDNRKGFLELVRNCIIDEGKYGEEIFVGLD